MAVVSRRVLLSAGCLAAWAAAFRQGLEEVGAGDASGAEDFIPGGHVGLPPLAHGRPRAAVANQRPAAQVGGFGWRVAPARMPSIPGQARTPAMMAGRTPYAERVGKTIEILEEWASDARVAQKEARSKGKEKYAETMKTTEAMCYSVMESLRSGRGPYNVFALTGLDKARGASDIQAIALVESSFFWPKNAKLSSSAETQFLRRSMAGDTLTETAHILQVVKTPKIKRVTGVRGELVRRIVKRNDREGRLVTLRPINDDTKKYWKQLGFEEFDSTLADHALVYSGYGLGKLESKEAYKMIVL